MLVPRGFAKGKSVEAIWDLDDSHHLLLHRQFVRQIAVVQRNPFSFLQCLHLITLECNRCAHDDDEIKKRKGEDAGT